MSRCLPLLAVLFAFHAVGAGCNGRKDQVCVELEELACNDCPYELTRCEFDGFEATEPSCEECQASREVLWQLCATGSEVTTDAFLEGLTCEPVDTGVTGA